MAMSNGLEDQVVRIIFGLIFCLAVSCDQRVTMQKAQMEAQDRQFRDMQLSGQISSQKKLIDRIERLEVGEELGPNPREASRHKD